MRDPSQSAIQSLARFRRSVPEIVSVEFLIIDVNQGEA